MLGRRSDRLAEGFRLLAAGAAVIVDPTLMTALKSSPGGYDALKKLAAAPPPGVARIAAELAAEARPLFAATRDLPPDAEALFVQMVEAAGPVTAPEIVAAGMDADALVEAMAAKLMDPEHRSGPMLALFRAVTTPALARLMADRAFADDLRAAFMAEVLRRLGDLSAALENLTSLSRDQMTALGDRFEIAGMFRLSDQELREALEKKAEEYRDYRARIEAIDERTAGLGNLKSAAKEAAERLDFDEVEMLLARVDEVETEIAAETKVLRADNALLRGRVDEAYRLLSAAADAFGSVGTVESARRRIDYAERLSAYSRRHGGAGFLLSARMIEKSLADLPTEDPHTARAHNNLALVLYGEGLRVGGNAGYALLLGSVREYERAHDAFDKLHESFLVSIANLNWGGVLLTLGEWESGKNSFEHLWGSIERSRAAQWLLDERDHPQSWAKAENNRGAALHVWAQRLGPGGGAIKLRRAARSFRSALRVWTEADHPSDWAMGQMNLGNALSLLGEWADHGDADALFQESVAAHRQALRIRTRETDPMGWAISTKNLTIALRQLGELRDGKEGVQFLKEVAETLIEVRSFFEACGQDVELALATEDPGMTYEVLANNSTNTDPCASLREAESYFAEAASKFDAQYMPYNHEKASAALARVRDRIARECA